MSVRRSGRPVLNVLRLVHTKQSNVLVTYFYVPKNTYRNIRILKTLPIPTLLFLLKIGLFRWESPRQYRFLISIESLFYSFYRGLSPLPSSHDRPHNTLTTHNNYRALLYLQKKRTYQNPARPTLIAPSYSLALSYSACPWPRPRRTRQWVVSAAV